MIGSKLSMARETTTRIRHPGSIYTGPKSLLLFSTHSPSPFQYTESRYILLPVLQLLQFATSLQTETWVLMLSILVAGALFA